jgi:hypothetical protein
MQTHVFEYVGAALSPTLGVCVATHKRVVQLA